MTFPATSVPDFADHPVGVEGGLAHVNGGRYEIDSRKADGAIPFGLAVVDGANDEQCRIPPVTAATADADGIKLSIASSASAVRFDKDDADGVLGYILNPARRITVTTSAHADFADSVGILRYMSHGRLVSESVTITTDGDDLHTSEEFADEFVDLYLPAQAGTGGAITIGVAAELGDLRGGVAVRDAAKQMAPSGTGYDDEDNVGVYRGGGPIWVRVEAAVDKDAPAFVRLVATGNERVGAFRGDGDGTAAAPDAVVMRGAHFRTDAASGELAQLEIE